jgi:hypothetical protein
VAGEPTTALATSDLSIYYEIGVKLFCKKHAHRLIIHELVRYGRHTH